MSLSILFFLSFFGACLASSEPEDDILFYHSKKIFSQKESLSNEETFLNQKALAVREKIYKKAKNILVKEYLDIFLANEDSFEDLFLGLDEFLQNVVVERFTKKKDRKNLQAKIKVIKIIIEDVLLLVAISEYEKLVSDSDIYMKLTISVASLVGKVSSCGLSFKKIGFYQFDPEFEVFTGPPYDSNSKLKNNPCIHHALLAVYLWRKIRYLEREKCNVIDLYLELFQLTLDDLFSRYKKKIEKLLEIFKKKYLTEKVPLKEHLLSPKHSFGYIFGADRIAYQEENLPQNLVLLLHKFCIMDQINFQLNFLYPKLVKSNIYYIKEFVDLEETHGVMGMRLLGQYSKQWFSVWCELFENGLTELLDYFAGRNEEALVIRRKIRILKVIKYKRPELLNKVKGLVSFVSSI
jgi:hypothetical protein